MEPSNFEVQRAISRVLAHEATDEDCRIVDTWVAQSADHELEFRRLEAVTRNARTLPPHAQWDVTAQWNALQKSLFPQQTSIPSVRRSILADRTPRSHWRRFGVPVLASLLVMAGAFFLITRARTPVDHQAVQQIYATQFGQQLRVNLDDGTRVLLTPRSRMTVVKFDAHDRIVALDGEAFFEVSRSEDRPFVVQTGTVRTRVLGTAFTVRHVAHDSAVRVAVLTGKVAVSNAVSQARTITLAAGDVGTVTDSTAIASQVTDMTPYTGWLSQRLVFQSRPTGEVLRELHRWYGYTFVLADSALASQTVTIGLSTKSLAEALTTLKVILDVDLKFDGTVITVVPRHGRDHIAMSRREIIERNHQPNRVGR